MAMKITAGIGITLAGVNEIIVVLVPNAHVMRRAIKN
jgi:hypothetical protein